MENQRESRAARQEHLYDQSVKQFLANKKLLAQILKGCVDEFKDCDVNDIANRYIEGIPEVGSVSYVPSEPNVRKNVQPLAPGDDIVGMANDQVIDGEGRRTFDICFFALAPKEDELIRIIVNVEAQKDFPRQYSLLRRAIYYCSRLISAQYDVEFRRSEFNDIRKVYSIWICANPTPEWKNTITRYSMKEENLKGQVHANEEDYDLLNVVILGLDPDGETTEKDLLYLLRVALAEKQNKDTLMDVLKEFGMENDPELVKEAENMCNLSQGVLETGRKEGIVLGRREGIVLGRREGREEGKDSQAKLTALNLHKLGMTDSVIAQAVGYAVETVTMWIKESETQAN